jgi:hypothetical protein
MVARTYPQFLVFIQPSAAIVSEHGVTACSLETLFCSVLNSEENAF